MFGGFSKRKIPQAPGLSRPGDADAGVGMFQVMDDFLVQFLPVAERLDLLPGAEYPMVLATQVRQKETAHGGGLEDPHVPTGSRGQLGMNVQANPARSEKFIHFPSINGGLGVQGDSRRGFGPGVDGIVEFESAARPCLIHGQAGENFGAVTVQR